MSIIVNTTSSEKDTTLINVFIEPKIFLNHLIQYKYILKQDTTILDLDLKYKFRPDRLAYDLWGQDLWYPVLLATNNMGSILEFNPERMGYTCEIPSDESLSKLLNIIIAKTNNIQI